MFHSPNVTYRNTVPSVTTVPTRVTLRNNITRCIVYICFQDASFEQEQRGLTAATQDELSLLLVVTLSGCGEINNQYSKGRTLGPGNEVNYYYALLAWLLYLCDVDNNNDSVPFIVVGMHQACQNGLLQLFVAAQPNEKMFYQNPSKGSLKNKTRSFHKAVSKYLSTHSLRGVYQYMEHVYLDGSRQVDENSYSSKMLSTCITVKQDSDAVRRVFSSKPGFFWETMELENSSDVFQDNDSCDGHVENTVVFVRPPLCYHPSCVLDLLTRIENEGCDVAGLRLTNEPDSLGNVLYLLSVSLSLSNCPSIKVVFFWLPKWSVSQNVI